MKKFSGFIILVLVLAACSSPKYLSDSYENETLAIQSYAELNEETQDYNVNTTIENKTNEPVQLLFNCGDIIWSTEMQKDEKASGDYGCPAVYSKTLAAGESTVEEETIPKKYMAEYKQLKMAYKTDQEESKVEVKLSYDEEVS